MLRTRVLVSTALALALSCPAARAQTPKIHIAFLWHMHQPVYWPGESVVETDLNLRYDYSVADIHLQRTGPYTTWPWDAVQAGIAASMPNFGAQVSISGSLMQNLDDLAAAGQTAFAGWTASWQAGHLATTSLGNPRLDLVAFGTHHPLMALLDPADVAAQITVHRGASAARFGTGTSRGIFPPENAFTSAMIPALAGEGIEWVLVDNVHFDRAAQGYPYNPGGNLAEPNRAEARNADPSDWVSLTGLWAPTPVSGGWGHRPHHVEHIDPATGAVSRIVAVPTERYMGNEDGRGGFGALQYDAVMSQLEPWNTDPDHPLLVVLHHDGDNYGGGTESYYHSNFQEFVTWLAANSDRFECTTVQDYLDRFPPDPGDVIHVEPGSWSGADNGDPEFKKWLGDVDGTGYSPDQNSWAVLTAARSHLRHAEAVAPSSPAVAAARPLLLNAQASDYWYWDSSQEGRWDSHPTRAANLALAEIAGLTLTPDATGPELFVPQREPYNPGEEEWGIVQPADFTVWTFGYDPAGLASVTLHVREDLDGILPVPASANSTYAGGAGVGPWQAWPMAAVAFPPAQTDPAPLVRADRFEVLVEGLRDVLLDYYVEATDLEGNVTRSPIQHVWVGGGGGSGTTWTMDGILDASAELVSGGSAVPLYVDVQGDQLYLATDAASPSGQDVFLVLNETPGAPQPAMWAKSGQVAGWDCFAGNESTNGWAGWFDHSGAHAIATGTVLEVVVDLPGEFGEIPAEIQVAVLQYDTADGGPLGGQFPVGDGSGDVETGEFFPISLRTTAAPAPGRRVRLTAIPNPFNPRTELRFELEAAGSVRLEIFDLRGRLRRVLLEGPRTAGPQSVLFDGRAASGSDLASGVYLAVLRRGELRLATTKFTILR